MLSKFFYYYFSLKYFKKNKLIYLIKLKNFNFIFFKFYFLNLNLLEKVYNFFFFDSLIHYINLFFI
jgi:hypothetical protein